MPVSSPSFRISDMASIVASLVTSRWHFGSGSSGCSARVCCPCFAPLPAVGLPFGVLGRHALNRAASRSFTGQKAERIISVPRAPTSLTTQVQIRACWVQASCCLGRMRERVGDRRGACRQDVSAERAGIDVQPLGLGHDVAIERLGQALGLSVGPADELGRADDVERLGPLVRLALWLRLLNAQPPLIFRHRLSPMRSASLGQPGTGSPAASLRTVSSSRRSPSAFGRDRPGPGGLPGPGSPRHRRAQARAPGRRRRRAGRCARPSRRSPSE